MITADFREPHEDARAEASRPADAAHGADRPRASAADLVFTLRVGLVAALVELGLVAYALLGGGAGAG
jgi:hypothetical protein